jgi:hypothetical protein
MEFENVNIQNLVSEFRDFAVEGFNIFALGTDDLPHLICVCPNKSFARAVQSLLTTAKRAQDLRILGVEITSNRCLSPLVLAAGKLVLVATVIDDVIWKNGNEHEQAVTALPNQSLGQWLMLLFGAKLRFGRREDDFALEYFIGPFVFSEDVINGWLLFINHKRRGYVYVADLNQFAFLTAN